MAVAVSAIKLVETVKAIDMPNVKAVVKAEIEQLSPTLLPLQEGMTQSSYTSGEGFKALILSIEQQDKVIRVKTGIFYTGVIAGCNCADDPSSIDEQTEYCELLFCVDITTANTTVTLL